MIRVVVNKAVGRYETVARAFRWMWVEDWMSADRIELVLAVEHGAAVVAAAADGEASTNKARMSGDLWEMETNRDEVAVADVEAVPDMTEEALAEEGWAVVAEVVAVGASDRVVHKDA